MAVENLPQAQQDLSPHGLNMSKEVHNHDLKQFSSLFPWNQFTPL